MNSVKTDSPTVNTSPRTASAWYLRMPGGNVFGPSPFAALLAWAKEGRIEPGSKVSTDNLSWHQAEDVAALGLELMIELDASNTVGPFHISAIHEFLADGSITLSTVLHNRRTGESSTVASKLTQTAELEKTAADLVKARSELDEATSRLHSATVELQTTSVKLQTTEAECQRTRDELQSVQKDLKTTGNELNASRVLLSTWKPEIESLRAECHRLRAAIEAEKAIRQETARAAAEATAAHHAVVRSAEEKTQRREAKFSQETAALEARIAAIAAQVGKKETELTAAHNEIEAIREQATDASRKVTERDVTVASLQEEVARARVSLEQQDALYRREQAEGAAFRIAAGRREIEFKALIGTLTNEVSLTSAEREAARGAETAAKERAAGLEKALKVARYEASHELEAAKNDRGSVERARLVLSSQLDATKGDLRVAREQVQALGSRVSEFEREREHLTDALARANADVKAMRGRVVEMTATVADVTAQRDAARIAQSELRSAIAGNEESLGSPTAGTDGNTIAQRLCERGSSRRNSTGDSDRLQSVLHQKESEIADLDRLLAEYRIQIHTLAERCANSESIAGTQPDPAHAEKSHGGRRKPMNAASWSFARKKDTAVPPTDHPLAGLEAKASRELLNWQRSKGGGQKKQG